MLKSLVLCEYVNELSLFEIFKKKSDFPSFNKNNSICFNLRTIEVSGLSSPKKLSTLNTTSALILTMCIQKTSLTSFLWRFSLLIQQLLV